MDVTFTQYIGLGHGSGGNFSRWLDELNFQFQQCISSLGGEEFDVLNIDLKLSGPKPTFGPPKMQLRKNRKARKIKGLLVLDSETYGKCKKSDERIRGLVEALAELTVLLCETVGRDDIASDFSIRVSKLADSVLER